LDLGFLGTDEHRVYEVTHGYAVVLTQDCDLEQDFSVRQKQIASDKLLPSVLFCEVATAEELFGRVKSLGSKLWDRIRINKDERYHFLQKIEADRDGLGLGMPELGIDFKRYFTIPTDEVYKRIEIGKAKRRCALVSPYLEHLSSRFAYFLSRVALPENHFSEAASRDAPPS
jgi:hypothetical protein